MPYQYWTPEETVVLLYFFSRGVIEDLVVDLTKLKCGTERSRRIREKIRNIRMKEIQAGRADFLIPGTKTYVHIIVDHWLSKQVDENKLRSLTAFDEEAREVVSRVSRISPPSLSFI